jgi:F-type H+-transporting ATPase subunit c
MRKALLILATLFTSLQAFAQDAAAGGHSEHGLYALGLGIMLGLAAFGATTGQGRVGASAMEGLARNPQARGAMFTPMIVVLVMIESLFILTWLVIAAKFI